MSRTSSESGFCAPDRSPEQCKVQGFSHNRLGGALIHRQRMAPTENVIGQGGGAPGGSSGGQSGTGGTGTGTGTGSNVQGQKTPEEIKKEHLANLDKAIVEAEDILRKKREEKKQLGGGTGQGSGEGSGSGQGTAVVINREDPSSQAWIKEIGGSVAPALQALEADQKEVFTLSLRRFLQDKPALAGNAGKLKELVDTYAALLPTRGITGRIPEGVSGVLEAAYGAIFSPEILRQARSAGIEAARVDSTLVDAATDHGGTGQRNTGDGKPRRRQLSAEEEQLAVRWYGSTDKYFEALEVQTAAE